MVDEVAMVQTSAEDWERIEAALRKHAPYLLDTLESVIIEPRAD